MNFGKGSKDTMFCRRFLMLAGVCIASCCSQLQSEPPPTAPLTGADHAYVLGLNDEITVQSPEIEEISKTFRVDGNGNINPPLVGRLHVAGRTAEQVESALTEKLKAYYTAPTISVSVTQFQSQPVSLLGAVIKPDIYQVQGRRTLFELIALAGGLRPDAGAEINLLRRQDRGMIPVAGAKLDNANGYWVATVPVKYVLDGKHPAYNIYVEPQDVISVSQAEMIYVIGSVIKSGGYLLGDKESMTALQAISLAGGLDRTASPQHAKVLRQTPGASNRQEIPINIKHLMGGEGHDFDLQASDILFIPNSLSKNVALRTLEATIQVGTGLAIYHP